jgi:RimJ/RimL family protein N-acetyltransferase
MTENATRFDLSTLRRTVGPYVFVGLRHEDLEPLRRFRNEQIDVLRQREPLTREDQERWWREVVVPTHAAADPAFLLVSILDGGGAFLGYGGLVHADWRDGRAEVSFLVDPARRRDDALYAADLRAFLDFLLPFAFEDLGLRRLTTEAYAFRTRTIALLEAAGFVREGVWREHTLGPDGEPVDSVLHGMLRRDWAGWVGGQGPPPAGACPP